jgi:hypothetical protein
MQPSYLPMRPHYPSFSGWGPSTRRCELLWAPACSAYLHTCARAPLLGWLGVPDRNRQRPSSANSKLASNRAQMLLAGPLHHLQTGQGQGGAVHAAQLCLLGAAGGRAAACAAHHPGPRVVGGGAGRGHALLPGSLFAAGEGLPSGPPLCQQASSINRAASKGQVCCQHLRGALLAGCWDTADGRRCQYSNNHSRPEQQQQQQAVSTTYNISPCPQTSRCLCPAFPTYMGALG